MREPRLYLYRKAGRTIWDAEMWLPDGRRATWRTGFSDRIRAESAATDRLASLIEGSAPGRGTPDPDGPVVLRTTPAPADDQPTESVLPTLGDPKPAEAWFHRLDTWFFDDLKSLLTDT